MSGHVAAQSCIATHAGSQVAQGSKIWTPSGSGFEDLDPKLLRVRRFGLAVAQGSKLWTTSGSGFEDLDRKWLKWLVRDKIIEKFDVRDKIIEKSDVPDDIIENSHVRDEIIKRNSKI